MSKNTNLLELDVDKLFVEHSIDEIVELEKLLSAEIERKRSELRSMVGDRYKDVLTASDAIKSMKLISEDIVANIDQISSTCEKLIKGPEQAIEDDAPAINKAKIEERTLVVQILLAIYMNEQIWIALDKNDNLDAAQFYLLAQHIHTGLSLTKKNILDEVPLLHQIKANLVMLRARIFQRILDKLQSVEITVEDTSSNLNALLLLQNQNSNELLSVFIQHRTTALSTVINSPHVNVRLQVSAMVRCIITTIHILHNCFINWNQTAQGLIWFQLSEIVNGDATLLKVELPSSPLNFYIPEIIQKFKPKYNYVSDETSLKNSKKAVEDWLNSTAASVNSGLETSLKLVTNVKGLHLIREEILKIELPADWLEICENSHLPHQFNVWRYFFQSLISQRAKELISAKVSASNREIQSDISAVLNSCTKIDADLRWYTWNEDVGDVSRTDNLHTGLSMKTKGYSTKIVDLCGKLDGKYLELLQDVSQYLYGVEFSAQSQPRNLSELKFVKKHVDREELEAHLRVECATNFTQITTFILEVIEKERKDLVLKSLIGARFLQAVTQLCPHFNKCCTFNNSNDDWFKICDNHNKTSHILLQNWLNSCVAQTELLLTELNELPKAKVMIKNIAKWDNIEIQEQTEEKTFKSKIQIPLKPSLHLSSILVKLSEDLNSILPHTLPKVIHVLFIEKNVQTILQHYNKLNETDLNQIHALQFLFDVKFLTTICIPRENLQLIGQSQDVCDKFRRRIDPFDLDVFYSHLQNNVKRAVCQTKMILGCLLPSSNQLANLGVSDKTKDQEKEPSIIAISLCSNASRFPLLPITIPSRKSTSSSVHKATNSVKSDKSSSVRKDASSTMKNSAAALFGGLTTDWFS